MRFAPTQRVVDKIQSLSAGARADLSALLAETERAKDRAALIESLGGSISLLEDKVFVLRRDNVRLFATFGADEEGDYLVLLDIASLSGRAYANPVPGNRNPKVNSRLNPRLNTAINPRINTSLNPRINTQINPRINTSINPRINTQINPRINTSINPHINTQINPRINTSINPRINTALNPRINTAYPGPYVYNLDLDRIGYVVRANDRVLLFFDNDGSSLGIGVLNAIHGYTLFDEKNEWIGQLVRDGQDGFLRFDEVGDHTGLVV